MSDLIRRSDVLETYANLYWADERINAFKDDLDKVYEKLRPLPSVEPEAKPPKWVAEDRYMKNHFKVFPHCSQCNAEVTTGQCYCMICGQHIDWSEDDGCLYCGMDMRSENNG